MVQLSHSYMTTGKIVALTARAFVSRVMSLLFRSLSRFVTAFLSRSKCLLILGIQFCTWRVYVLVGERQTHLNKYM